MCIFDTAIDIPRELAALAGCVWDIPFPKDPSAADADPKLHAPIQNTNNVRRTKSISYPRGAVLRVSKLSVTYEMTSFSVHKV